MLFLFCVFYAFFFVFVSLFMLDTKLKFLKCCLRWYQRANTTWSTSDQKEKFSDLDLEHHGQWRLQRIFEQNIAYYLSDCDAFVDDKKRCASIFVGKSNVRWETENFCSDGLRWYLRANTTWSISNQKKKFSDLDLEQHVQWRIQGITQYLSDFVALFCWKV